MNKVVDSNEIQRKPGGITGKGFRKGVSGNPGGLPAGFGEVRELARSHTAAAVRALVEALEDPRQKVAAATAILDRGYGKPTQPIEGDGNLIIQIISGVTRAPDDPSA